MHFTHNFYKKFGSSYWVIIALISVLITFVACKRTSIKVTSVSPNPATINTSTVFTVYGENFDLAQDLVFSMNGSTCSQASDSTTEDRSKKLLTTCSTPETGESTKLSITDNDSEIENSPVTITLQDRFIKLDAKNKKLANAATEWQCVKDTVNDNLWQFQSSDAATPYAFTHKFQWSAVGTAGETTQCSNTLNPKNCNSVSLIEYANENKLCGVSGWRLPSTAEIKTIFDCNTTQPIKPQYFPNYNFVYWTRTTQNSDNTYAFQLANCNAAAYPNTNYFSIILIN